MWDYTDNQLKKFQKQQLKESKKTQDRIQDAFNGTKQIDEYVNKNDLDRLKRDINENYEYFTEYGKFQADRRLKRRKMMYDDWLWFYLYMAYVEEQFHLLEAELKIFALVGAHIYVKEKEQLKKQMLLKKGDLDVDKVIKDTLNNPNSKGYVWKDYNDAMTEYNTTELYNQAIQNIRANKPLDINDKEFQKIIDKQNKRLININGDKISGALDNELTLIANNVKLETYIFNGIEKCKFIAMHDIKTTRMCGSLDGQIFNVHDWNRFIRYSASASGYQTYNVYGMIPGVNLPPIDDNFHYCRSTIIYQLDKEVEKDTRTRLNKKNNETNKRQEKVKNERM